MPLMVEQDDLGAVASFFKESQPDLHGTFKITEDVIALVSFFVAGAPNDGSDSAFHIPFPPFDVISCCRESPLLPFGRQVHY